MVFALSVKGVQLSTRRGEHSICSGGECKGVPSVVTDIKNILINELEKAMMDKISKFE